MFNVIWPLAKGVLNYDAYNTIVNNIHNNKKCNITDVIQVSGFSRSTVYKAIKEFENQGLVSLIQSDEDRREVFLDIGIV